MQQLPQVFDDEVRRAEVYVLPEPLVYSHYVHELVRQVVLGTFACLQRYRRSDSDRRYRKQPYYQPLRSHVPKPYKLQIVVRYLLESFADGSGA